MRIDPGEEQEAIRELLKRDYFLDTIQQCVFYTVQTDDSDGDNKYGLLHVIFGPDGDGHISIKAGEKCRFRTYYGGGKHPMVRHALEILAEAIRLEGEEATQGQRQR